MGNKVLKLLILPLFFLSPVSLASDPVRPATPDEIDANDPHLVLGMGIKDVWISNVKAKDSFYRHFEGRDLLNCVSALEKASRPRFERSVLIVDFSISKSGKGQKVDLKYLPHQSPVEAEKCLMDKLSNSGKTLGSQASKIKGRLEFRYSRPVKYD